MSTLGELLPVDEGAVIRAGEAIPPEDHLRVVVEVFEVLADRTRARILYALGTGPLCVRDLAIVVGVSQSAMSHQLRVLRDRRVVKTRRAGNTIYYSVDDQHLAVLLREAGYHADHVRHGLPDHPVYRASEQHPIEEHTERE